jgi:upstream activation factor subunit UAF30
MATAKKAAPKKAVKKAAPKKAATKSAPKAAKKATTKKAPAKAAPKKAVAKKAAPAKAAPKKAAPKKAAPKKAARKANAAFLKPLNASPALAEVIGSKPLSRPDIVKKIWDYIKKNGLQDAKNKRMINADAKLKTLFAGKMQISMFDLAKVVSANVQ